MNDSNDRYRGLTAREAAGRLAAEGFNELPARDRRTPIRIIAEVVTEPMFGLLLAGGALYLILGDFQEAVMLIAFAGLSVTITVVQESRSERVLEALRDFSSPRALVIRDGAPVRVAGREIVRGDIVVLTEGDRVAADGTMLSGQDLLVDESLLTGEAMPVRKVSDTGMTMAKPGGDDTSSVYSGTLVVRGRGFIEVLATGGNTEIGRIGRSLAKIEPEPTPLSVQTRRLVRIFAIFGIGASVAAVILYGVVRGSWLDGLLGGIALSMSMLPEEFPLVLAVFMVMGVWRISRVRVLTRRAATIETLGAATVLCSDKTGTLTQNRMMVAELRTMDTVWRPVATAGTAMPETIRQLAMASILASPPQPTDPMDIAVHALPCADLAHIEVKGWSLERTYGLRPELLAMSLVWSTGAGSSKIVASKGAPEAIASLCHLGTDGIAEVRRMVDAMASAGLRVLGVARAEFRGDNLPDTQAGFSFQFLGLVGFHDPLRANASAAVNECKTAGIRVVMITGDYPATARAIAAEAGIDSERVVSGDEITVMSDEALRLCVKSVSVFARVMPEQKLRIVTALKGNGEIVAMTGDGVNDAPSLKAAHIGVAMGGRGTDVAREAASIVLLDDDFSSLVRTIRLGRRIYDNILKAFAYILAVHIPIAGLSLLPLVTGWPLILGPIHIAFIEMIIDPVCSIVFEVEREEDDIMRRPPRSPSQSLFSSTLIGWGLFQGLLAFAAVGGTVVLGMSRNMPEDELRALAFVSLIATIVGLILVNRANSTSLLSAFRHSGLALWGIVGVATALLMLSVSWPVAEALFHFGPLHANDLAICLAAGAAVLVILDLVKGQFHVGVRR